jgi:hypothetical protein
MSSSYYNSYTSIHDVQDLRTVTEAEVISFDERENELLQICADRANYWPDYTYLMRQRETFNTSLSDALLLGNTGALVHEDKIVIESMLDAKKCLRSPSYRKEQSLNTKYKTGTYSSIFYLPEAKNLYHWLIECIPRLFVLTKHKKDNITIVIHKDICKLNMEILDSILEGIDNISIEFISKEEKWSFEEYIFPSFPANLNSGYLPNEIAYLMRDNIMGSYNSDKNKEKNKIYISRKNADCRRVVNREDIYNVLRKNDFKVVRLETMPYSEQVSLLSSSDFIIGPHGAGLSNILYSDDAKVLELFSPVRIRPHYFMLSKSLGHTYDYLIGKKEGDNQDFFVNASKLERKIVNLMSL